MKGLVMGKSQDPTSIIIGMEVMCGLVDVLVRVSLPMALFSEASSSSVCEGNVGGCSVIETEYQASNNFW